MWGCHHTRIYTLTPPHHHPSPPSIIKSNPQTRGGKNLSVGQVVRCVVESNVGDGRAVAVSIEPEKLRRARGNASLGLDMNSLTAGILIDATISKTLDDGFELSFLSMTVGAFVGADVCFGWEVLTFRCSSHPLPPHFQLPQGTVGPRHLPKPGMDQGAIEKFAQPKTNEGSAKKKKPRSKRKVRSCLSLPHPPLLP